jgi:multiple sugar transport system substrate-binding protein
MSTMTDRSRSITPVNPSPFIRRGLGALLLVFLAVAGAAGCGRDTDRIPELDFWVMGREGEMVQALVREFEARNPDVRVRIQQIPWSAAHEKMLTAHVGKATPDLAQLGNTWVPEFQALGALAELGGLVADSDLVNPEDHFSGIWDTNVIKGKPYGIPWYVDTRLLFYRTDLLAEAGFPQPPGTWQDWRRSLEALSARGPEKYGILLPINEWTQPVILGLQAGSTLLVDQDTHGDFSGPAFGRALDFYLSLFADGLAPPVSNSQVANLYQEFARGTFAMFISGPWNIGECRRRLPDDLQDDWATAPMPAPEGDAPGVSLAGGSSLVLFQSSSRKEAAWRLIEFLSRPEQQVRFFNLTGDLPANKTAWSDSAMNSDPMVQAFWEQLQHVAPTPKIPEWEQIATRIWERIEAVIRGAETGADAMAKLDADVERILTKRRWLLSRDQGQDPQDGAGHE